MKIKALVSFLVAVCFVTVNVLAQAPVEKKAEKAKIEKVEKKAEKKAAKKDTKKDDCDPKTCKDAKNAKKPCCADKKPAKAEEKK